MLKKTRNEIELQLNELTTTLGLLDPDVDEEEYYNVLQAIERLNKLSEKNSMDWSKILEIGIGVAGQAGLMMLVMNYEKTDVIVTKAWNMIRGKG